MGLNFKELESRLSEACQIVHREFITEFNNDKNYVSPRGAKLEAFINNLQSEFENTTIDFLKEEGLEANAKAKSKALAIAKLCAKKCLEDFNKIKKTDESAPLL